MICPASTAGSYPVVGFRIVSSAVIEVGIGPRRNIEKESAQTIISFPDHTAVCAARALGPSLVLVAIQVSVSGLYLPPVFA